MGIFSGEKDYSTSLKELLEQLWEYQEAEASLMVDIATLQYENGDINDALGFLEKSVIIYHELGFAEDEAIILDLIGDVYIGADDIPNALDYYNRSLKLCLSLNMPLKAEVTDKIKKYGEYLQINEDGVDKGKLGSDDESFLSPDVDVDYSIDYVNIGIKLDDIISLLDESAVYSTYQEFRNPMAQLEEAYEMAHSIGDENGEGAILLIMGDLSLKDEKTKKSLEFFKRSLNSYQKIGDMKGQAISKLMIGTALFLLGETEEGSDYLRKSMDIIKDLEDVNIEKAALALLKSIYGD
ncbi:tetratricopeptide repeat protein [Methanobacterium subterraneum]|uniref:Tetratricopeptide repeat protein n=1 Tax=Methanobacterium subterraneum TaxID=59277 RepID=A0A7K4DLY2_9EURY|nr:tetratricopeptide repeat protein [Methanobacterium subterraneum]MBW4257393.1 tetratricopeptide repeat protein [Methanobacterium sp. YSL]NMO09056.1 tetratricopeptide repeat protein [Methanobacterium subterraneum]PKL73046.1 MAG: tetratricopeptide repeat-containing protein [Methanobacteriales archaeon HGW-Methanobacteriales-2]